MMFLTNLSGGRLEQFLMRRHVRFREDPKGKVSHWGFTLVSNWYRTGIELGACLIKHRGRLVAKKDGRVVSLHDQTKKEPNR